MTDEAVQHLTSGQFADLKRQFQERDEKMAERDASLITSLPLPRCPSCDGTGERIETRVEDPEFGVDETALRLRWLPCGHRFRTVVEMDAPPVDEYRLSTRPRVVSGGS